MFTVKITRHLQLNYSIKNPDCQESQDKSFVLILHRERRVGNLAESAVNVMHTVPPAISRVQFHINELKLGWNRAEYH